MRLIALLIIAALAVAAYAASEYNVPNDGLPLVRADYPLCVTVSPGPLAKPGRPDARPRPSEIV